MSVPLTQNEGYWDMATCKHVHGSTFFGGTKTQNKFSDMSQQTIEHNTEISQYP